MSVPRPSSVEPECDEVTAIQPSRRRLLVATVSGRRAFMVPEVLLCCSVRYWSCPRYQQFLSVWLQSGQWCWSSLRVGIVLSGPWPRVCTVSCWAIHGSEAVRLVLLGTKSFAGHQSKCVCIHRFHSIQFNAFIFLCNVILHKILLRVLIIVL